MGSNKLQEILADLHAKKRSGILRIERESAKKQLVLRNGLLALAESNLPQEHLARIMIKMRLMPRAKMKAIASLMKTGMTSEEAILAQGSSVEDVEKGRHEQAVVITKSLLGWNLCTSCFYPGEGMVRYRVNLGLQMPELIAVLAPATSKPLPVPAGAPSDSQDQMLEEVLIRFQSANLYEILSVGAEASQEEIQNAYHEQAKKLHPDRFQSSDFSTEVRRKAEQIFARINEAYFTLKNPYSRAVYDEKRFAPGAKTAEAKSGVAQPEEMAAALFREGRILLAKGDAATAVERLKGCVWLCPEKSAYHHYLGVAQSKITSLRKSAEQHLLKSIELEDLTADSHLALASLYIDVNLPRKAELQLQQVLLLDPENVEARKLSAELKKLR
jgi:hypothetical protein